MPQGLAGHESHLGTSEDNFGRWGNFFDEPGPKPYLSDVFLVGCKTDGEGLFFLDSLGHNRRPQRGAGKISEDPAREPVVLQVGQYCGFGDGNRVRGFDGS